MLNLGFGILVLVLGLQVMRYLQRADPLAKARLVRVAAGVVLLSVAAELMLRGVPFLALVPAGVGAWLVWGSGRLQRAGGATSSRIVTDHLDVWLNPLSGALDGRVLKGLLRGRSIASLKPAELALLWQDCRFDDPPSARLLEAHLARCHPTWREDLARGEREMSGLDGRVTPREALKILGLEPGAVEEDIRRAHRTLILKMHPDRGGSTYLAAKINEAKDVLLGELGA